jgi:hypothetical protein
MTQDRALEILAAYGADPARWPSDEREALQALADRSPAVAQALVEARAVDAALAGWLAAPAASVTPARDDGAAARAALAEAQASGVRPHPVRTRRWWGGLAVAASLVAAVGLSWPSLEPASPPAGTGGGTIAGVQAPAPDPREDSSEEEALFALMFTPTIDEEPL